MTEDRLPDDERGRDSVRIERVHSPDATSFHLVDTPVPTFDSKLFDESWTRTWNVNRLTLMVRGPKSVFAYWEIRNDWMALLSQHFRTDFHSLPFSLRLHDVTDMWFDGHHSHRQFVVTPSNADNWYFQDVEPDRNYLADYGTWTPEGQFFAILRSNVVRTPRLACASGEIRFARPGEKTHSEEDDAPEWPPPSVAYNAELTAVGVPPYTDEFNGYGAITRTAHEATGESAKGGEML